MRHFALRSVAAMLIAVLSCGVQSAWAHGGGGHGGGGFGGGGHMGGFGGGHVGGFGGGHMGGFGGFSGGHVGGFSGGHHSGFGGIPMGSHIGGFSGSTHHSGLSGSSFNSLHSMGTHHLGGSSLGSHSALGHSALGGSSTIHHNPNSFTNRHVGAGTVTQGFRGTHHGTQSLTSHVGANAQSLLGHKAGSLGNNATFLNHHHIGSTNLGATNFGGHHGLNNQLGGTGLNSLHHHGNFNGMGNHHHHGNFFFNPFFGFYPFGLGFGFGWPYYGFGYPYGYGYGYGLGYGYGSGYFRYNPYCYYGGYGNYGAYGYPVATTAAAPTAPTAPASTTAADDAKVFAEKGEADFRAGNYKGAVYAWRHAVVDDPKNGVLMMMLGQGLFATGQFDEAAGATQQAMQLLPEDQWGVVVKNFRELYGKTRDYTTQLRALEKDVKTSGENPATRFLLGFHYGYLGYPSHAVKQLDKTLTLAPQDQMAQRLREIMVGPQPGDQKPDGKPEDANQDAGGKSADDGQPQDKATATKQAVDT